LYYINTLLLLKLKPLNLCGCVRKQTGGEGSGGGGEGENRRKWESRRREGEDFQITIWGVIFSGDEHLEF
jgi:hypothetical protein